MNIRSVLSMSLMVAVVAVPVLAQQRARVLGPPLGEAVILPGPPAGIEPTFDLLGTEPLDMGEAVVGAPYSADVVTEVVQKFADGNRIERRVTSTVARDGRGRVRREQSIAAIGPLFPDAGVRIVTLSDPAAGVHYSLDAKRKVAMRAKPLLDAAVAPANEPAPGGEGEVLFFEPAGAPPDVRTESLGTRELEGVRVEGTRTTVVVPAGAIGNRKPIEVTTRRWYSPELRVVVMSTRTDPRFGETTYRLTNIRRAEPPAELVMEGPLPRR